MILEKMMNRTDAERRNICNVLLKFAAELNIKATKTSLEKELLDHPDYPSLLAVSDTLNYLGINTYAVEVDLKQLIETEGIFISQILINGDKYFTVIKSVTLKEITYLDVFLDKYVRVGYDQFLDIFLGLVLFSDQEKDLIEEIDYVNKKKAEDKAKKEKVIHTSFFVFILLITVAILPYTNGWTGWVSLIIMLLSFFGAVLTYALLKEGDEEGDMQAFCKTTNNVDCEFVIKSDIGVLGVKLTHLSFSYFATVILIIFSASLFKENIFPSLAIMSFGSILFCIYSIYLQLKIIKKWCKICLFIALILCLEASAFCFIFLNNGSDLSNVSLQHCLLIIATFSVLLLFTRKGVELNRSHVKADGYRRKYLAMKRNTDFFYFLLSKQKKIESSPVGLGLMLGNPNAKYQIIKVCNPYCGPCSSTHAEIDILLASTVDISIQIIFIAAAGPKDIRTFPIIHFLALEEKKDNELLSSALSEWYHMEKKNYEQFATRFPVETDLKLQQHRKVEMMYDWCSKTEIKSTPTFFINGYKLPDDYRIEELKYLLR